MSASVAVAVGMAGIRLGNETGIFAKHCIEMGQNTVAAPPSAMAEVAGGSADLTYLPVNSMLIIMASGVDLRAVAPDHALDPAATEDTIDKYSAFGIYLPKGKTISSAADLAEKTIAVPGRATIAEISTAAAVDAKGGDPTKIKWAVLDPPTMIQQLETGKIDAAVLPHPFSLELDAKGYERAVSPEYHLFDAGANDTLWVTTAKAYATKPDAFAAFAAAMKEINAYAMNNQDELNQVVANETKTPLDLVVEGPNFFVNEDISPERDVQPVAELLVQLGYLKSIPDTSGLVPELA
ncbi:ABC transporter substrate-binding protein [Prescottella equi]|uniref:ABC transporter substrate-binding protein n=1 Tax=Rhodococcus hoagii TaxID=43767 RepID=UPI001584C605|nr:ABC transporter substrate-binding protein [Prescottella equi]